LSIVTTSDEVLKEATLSDPAVKLARSPFPFYNDCDYLWSGTVATGSNVIQPTSQHIESTTPIVSDVEGSINSTLCSDTDNLALPKRYKKNAKADEISTLQDIIKMLVPPVVPPTTSVPSPIPESDSRQLIAWASTNSDITEDQSANLAFFLLHNPNAAHLAMSFTNDRARISFIRKLIPDF
jgi:hypothetical protein